MSDTDQQTTDSGGDAQPLADAQPQGDVQPQGDAPGPVPQMPPHVLDTETKGGPEPEVILTRQHPDVD